VERKISASRSLNRLDFQPLWLSDPATGAPAREAVAWPSKDLEKQPNPFASQHNFLLKIKLL